VRKQIQIEIYPIRAVKNIKEKLLKSKEREHLLDFLLPIKKISYTFMHMLARGKILFISFEIKRVYFMIKILILKCNSHEINPF
jgi:hypothetical protein